MALNRECEMVLFSDPTHECAGSRLSPPENLVSTVPCAERCNRTWNNRSLTGQGSNSATCRICRVSRRRSGHVISRAVGRAARKPFCFLFTLLRKKSQVINSQQFICGHHHEDSVRTKWDTIKRKKKGNYTRWNNTHLPQRNEKGYSDKMNYSRL
jgi:hypothetical protein